MSKVPAIGTNVTIDALDFNGVVSSLSSLTHELVERVAKLQQPPTWVAIWRHNPVPDAATLQLVAEETGAEEHELNSFTVEVAYVDGNGVIRDCELALGMLNWMGKTIDMSEDDCEDESEDDCEDESEDEDEDEDDSSPKTTTYAVEIKDPDGFNDLMNELQLSVRQREVFFMDGEVATINITVDKDLNIVAGHFVRV
jgi:hypothetical protein